MFVGMFGSIFLLAQYFQTVQGASPLQSGLRILPWTAMPILIAPIAGMRSDRIGGRPIMWKDTVLVRTGETVDILLDVTNPGTWMAHCHIAEHHESGMMFSFNVE